VKVDPVLISAAVAYSNGAPPGVSTASSIVPTAVDTTSA